MSDVEIDVHIESLNGDAAWCDECALPSRARVRLHAHAGRLAVRRYAADLCVDHEWREIVVPILSHFLRQYRDTLGCTAATQPPSTS